MLSIREKVIPMVSWSRIYKSIEDTSYAKAKETAISVSGGFFYIPVKRKEEKKGKFESQRIQK